MSLTRVGAKRMGNAMIFLFMVKMNKNKKEYFEHFNLHEATLVETNLDESL